MLSVTFVTVLLLVGGAGFHGSKQRGPARLKLGDDLVVEGEQIVDFLSGGESEQAVFVFDDVPPAAKVELRVASFLLP